MILLWESVAVFALFGVTRKSATYRNVILKQNLNVKRNNLTYSCFKGIVLNEEMSGVYDMTIVKKALIPEEFHNQKSSSTYTGRRCAPDALLAPMIVCL